MVEALYIAAQQDKEQVVTYLQAQLQQAPLTDRSNGTFK